MKNKKFKEILESPASMFSIICAVIMLVVVNDLSISFSFCMLDLYVYIMTYTILVLLKESNKKYVLIFSMSGLGCLILITSFLIFKASSEILNPYFELIHSEAGTGYIKAFLICAVHLFCLWSAEFFRALKRYNNRELYSERKFSPTNKNFSLDENITPVLSIAEGAVKVFEKKNLERFLMRDYLATSFLSYGDFSDKTKTHDKLQKILVDILEFLELPKLVNLEIIYDNENSTGKTNVGTFQSDVYWKKITIHIKDYCNPNNVIAILCHECAHYFMEYNKLNWNDTELNEQRTDIVANLIGFNRIMTEGYKEIKVTENSGELQTVFTHKLGYITYEDCRDIGKFLDYLRENIAQKLNNAKILDEIKQEIQSHISTAKTLNEQLKFIDVRKLDTNKPEKIIVIQKILIEIENRNINNEISRYQEAFEKIHDIENAETLNKSIYNLCSELISWISTFQSLVI